MKTTVDIDKELACRAAEILGTTTLKNTVDAALREVLRGRRREELADAILAGTLSVPALEELARSKEPRLPVGLLDEPGSDAA